MALVQNRKNSALRVCFLANSQFDAENAASGGRLKKRALRCIMRQVRYPVVEYTGEHVDAVFYLLRAQGGGWILRKQRRTV